MNKRRLNFSAVLLGAASLSLLALSTSHAQTSTATTIPVGYQQITVPPATDTSTPVSTVISVPFYNSAAYAGLVSTVDSSSSLSIATSTWTASQFVSATAPYLLHFKSGTSVGRYFLITANTDKQLTVATRGYDLTQVAAASNTFEVVPANTLGSLFGTTSVPFQSGGDSTVADNILLWNGSTWGTYFFNGSRWSKTGSLGNQNNVILYPDEGIYITRRASTPLALTFVGTVPSVTESSDLVGPGSTFVSNRYPADTTLVNFGFQNLPNWQSGTTAATADNVLLWNGTTWLTYFYNGSNWSRSGSLGNQNTRSIPSGTAAFVTRQSSASGTTASLVQALPYSLN